jgi:hypothetical protein
MLLNHKSNTLSVSQTDTINMNALPLHGSVCKSDRGSGIPSSGQHHAPTLTSIMRITYRATYSFYLTDPQDGNCNIYQNVGTQRSILEMKITQQ